MLSLVIPALNAEASLGACIAAAQGADEVLVVDGGSSDATAEVAELGGATVVWAKRGRGVQLAAGSAAAKGDWLLFLHADTMLAPGWLLAAGRHMAGPEGEAACFTFRLDDAAWQARLIERGVAWRTRRLGLPYGDQGLLISRRLYDAIGGYRPLPLMEDVDIVRRIGRGRMRMLDADAVTSAQRWRRDGWFRRSVRNIGLLTAYLAGIDPGRLARSYH